MVAKKKRRWFVYVLIFVIILIVYLIINYYGSKKQRAEYEQFKSLCESTGGTFYDDCHRRMAVFCTYGIEIENIKIACSCEDGMKWDSDKGCTSLASFSKQCETDSDCKPVVDYCTCKSVCVNQYTELENCPVDFKNCTLDYDTQICYCRYNQCIEGPTE